MNFFRFGFGNCFAMGFVMAVLITLGPTGRCDAEGMEYPLAVVAAADGTLFVADRNLPGIWKVQEGKATIYVQGSKKFRTPLNAIRCLALGPKGELYAGDSSTREVYRVDSADKLQPLTTGGIGIPAAIGVDSSGDLFVADLERQAIFKVPAAGGKPEEFASVQAARGLAVDAMDRIWVLSHSKQPLVRYTKDKKSEVILTESPFQFSNHLTVDKDGNAYLCDGYGKSVWKIAAGGKPEKFVEGEPLKNPVGIAIGSDRLWVADPHQKSIYAWGFQGDKKPIQVIQ